MATVTGTAIPGTAATVTGTAIAGTTATVTGTAIPETAAMGKEKATPGRSEEDTAEVKSPMSTKYADLGLKKKKKRNTEPITFNNTITETLCTKHKTIIEY